MTDWKSIPIPPRMQSMRKDHRGFPVPYIIMDDAQGKPLFAVNDADKQRQCVKELLCPICGSKLERLLWFVGGPLSAFHEHGAYHDSAMHYECMEYALQVCPHLAMSNYSSNGTVSEAQAKRVPEGVATKDITQIPGKPIVFVAIACNTFSAHFRDVYFLRPKRPYLEIEYWRAGKKLSPIRGFELISGRFQ